MFIQHGKKALQFQQMHMPHICHRTSHVRHNTSHVWDSTVYSTFGPSSDARLDPFKFFTLSNPYRRTVVPYHHIIIASVIKATHLTISVKLHKHSKKGCLCCASCNSLRIIQASCTMKFVKLKWYHLHQKLFWGATPAKTEMVRYLLCFMAPTLEDFAFISTAFD